MGGVSDDELQFGDEVDDEPSVSGLAPPAGFGASSPTRPRSCLEAGAQGSEGLGQGGVRDVPLVLVELTGREETTRRDEHLMQFVHHRGLAISE